jgi:hypothetical protein
MKEEAQPCISFQSFAACALSRQRGPLAPQPSHTTWSVLGTGLSPWSVRDKPSLILG